ncbi:arsenate reductase (glutaredoxin) [Grimontia hollisae]|uniref:Arsenate reductase n=2 Tax=Grimontia hollisae TaxID=673 RepID=D0ICH3_GRIHO|nr:arsenate reductase (glutaredoxin) [Grimontia hollisae]AMG29965.1 arsenate reductase (glutaredoxin) [Grimontia hollisae]EEY71591.1 arsenate reductase [Grimontia hollisae CIP 101886]MDF2183530.1 arsenate reductase (glutaredoxin) [Grimontia hollisae]STO42965.1 arsenate reductase [Grimontia hollisae]STO56691.1 arsenate reductase [Grimontia hollisae]
MSVTIYHNARCSKSRQTLALLQEKGIEPEIVAYLDTPLSANTLKTLQRQLGFDSPRQMMRTKEDIYNALKLADATDEQLIQAMVDNPKLIERPIVVANDKAVMGRPPENVLTIL